MPAVQPGTRLAINATSSGDNVLLANPTKLYPTAGRQSIVVLSLVIVADGSVVAQFFSADSSGTALSGPMPIAASGSGIGAAYNEGGHFCTQAGEDFVLNLALTTATGIFGWFTYRLALPG